MPCGAVGMGRCRRFIGDALTLTLSRRERELRIPLWFQFRETTGMRQKRNSIIAQSPMKYKNPDDLGILRDYRGVYERLTQAGGYQGLAAVLPAAAAGGALGGQALFLSLGPEEAAVLQLAQNAGVLYGSTETVDQALGVFTLAGGYIRHASLLSVGLL